MWKSRAASLFQYPIRRRSPIQTQVPAEILTLISHSTPLSSKWVFFSVRNPRPFSAASTNPRFELKESQNPSVFETVDASINGDGGLGENRDTISDSRSPGLSKSPSWDFGGGDEKLNPFSEDPSSVVADESSDTPLVFKESNDKDNVEGDSLSSLWNESIDVDDKNGIFESGDGTTTETLVIDGDEAKDILASEEGIETETCEIDDEQLENVLSLLQGTLQEPLDLALDKLDLKVSEEFVVRVIQSPHVSCEKSIGFFKWALQVNESVKTSRAIELLVRKVTSENLSKKEVYTLWDLLKDICNEKGLLTTGILNQLISVFWGLSKGKVGLEVFEKFSDFGCEPDADTYYLTIQALYTRRMIDAAWSVCEKMIKSGSFPDREKVGEIITCLCKGKKAKEAHFIYSEAKAKNISPQSSNLEFLIERLLRSGKTVPKALELLEDYSGELSKYANKTYGSVVRGLCQIKNVKEAKNLLLRMVESGPPPGNATFNYVITALSKEGDLDDAVALTKVMENRGLRPDVYTYTVIMSGYAKGGSLDEAYKVFREAKRRHPKLSPINYHILIRGYCNMEEFDKALECLKEMREDGLKPNADEYNKLIKSLCLKALDWRKAEQLLEEMKETGIHLMGATRSLIAAIKELEEEVPLEEVAA